MREAMPSMRNASLIVSRSFHVRAITAMRRSGSSGSSDNTRLIIAAITSPA